MGNLVAVVLLILLPIMITILIYFINIYKKSPSFLGEIFFPDLVFGFFVQPL